MEWRVAPSGACGAGLARRKVNRTAKPSTLREGERLCTMAILAKFLKNEDGATAIESCAARQPHRAFYRDGRPSCRHASEHGVHRGRRRAVVEAALKAVNGR